MENKLRQKIEGIIGEAMNIGIEETFIPNEYGQKKIDQATDKILEAVREELPREKEERQRFPCSICGKLVCDCQAQYKPPTEQKEYCECKEFYPLPIGDKEFISCQICGKEIIHKCNVCGQHWTNHLPDKCKPIPAEKKECGHEAHCKFPIGECSCEAQGKINLRVCDNCGHQLNDRGGSDRTHPEECKHEWIDYPMHPSKYCRKCGVNRESEPKPKDRIKKLDLSKRGYNDLWTEIENKINELIVRR